MSTEDQIQALLAVAAPLRLLDPDDAAAESLSDLVNQINRLRAKQAEAQQAADLAALSEPKEVPADRGWLERKAVDLGIAFRSNISDAILKKRIDEAAQ